LRRFLTINLSEAGNDLRKNVSIHGAPVTVPQFEGMMAEPEAFAKGFLAKK
jgi:hypothetical protein